ncbi:hypothetical protein J6TS1_20780 [Siminovitchia terrae]|uniref:Uncharacterized protein n=1 Tax=Siminovitchia terrae TaxID=1914933 RepID=A0A429X5Y8_SIMTE|nr:hypothetical protein [Siminovitchia terrae]RST58673.1 hypothetical protein D5F11_016740 [Siminovitchia terrae]GIN92657.1 hypothetical protein J22TS1_37080 [Siminovitchia terrae]GIN96208.1 hypothetical protein J6TS1_20780 [Siminovitchia terrae]
MGAKATERRGEDNREWFDAQSMLVEKTTDYGRRFSLPLITFDKTSIQKEWPSWQRRVIRKELRHLAEEKKRK